MFFSFFKFLPSQVDAMLVQDYRLVKTFADARLDEIRSRE